LEKAETFLILNVVAIDRKTLPQNAEVLQQMVVDLAGELESQQQRLARTEHLLQQLLRARYGRKSERLSEDQLALFQAELNAQGTSIEDILTEAEQEDSSAAGQDDKQEPPPSAPPAGTNPNAVSRGRKSFPKHFKRERIEYDLSESDKHCQGCDQTLRRIGEDLSEKLEYIPASMKVIEEARAKYACACTVKTAGKPSSAIEKSTAGASLLAQVIVSKYADHAPLNRQEKIFARHGLELSRQTMSGWMGRCAQLLEPLKNQLKKWVLESEVVQTDDTPVAVLDRTIPKTRTGRIWTYVGDTHHPGVVYDYTPTRKRDGPDEFLGNYKGYLQADAYAGYDHLYTDAKRGVVEVACWAHARRKFFEAKETDVARMGAVLAQIARLYAMERQGKGMDREERRLLREHGARPVLAELHAYLLGVKDQVLPKSPAGQAVAYSLSNWAALCRYVEDGELAIDNNAAERTMRGIAVGRKNWLFFGSDGGGNTAAVLRSFVATCERIKIDPWVWFHDVLARIPDWPMNRLQELLPHRWAELRS
jgi:transposase